MVALTLVVAVSGCGSAMKQAQSAAAAGDWDSAVAYYREVVANDGKNVQARISLERAMRNAATEHSARAKVLEAQDQLPGAMAEYKLASDYDRANTFYLTKALSIERTLRERAEAARPPARIDTLRQQAAQQPSPFQILDPRTVAPMSFPNAAARDIIASLSKATGITVTYDRNADTQLTTAYPLETQGERFEVVLNQILTAFNMAYKVTGPSSIFIFQDTAQNRQKYDDLYELTFYLEHIELQEMIALITQHTMGGTGVRPVIQPIKGANAISVKATAGVLQLMEQLVRVNDKPRADVMIQVEILEVDRSRLLNLGVDLSNWQLGFALSPEISPSTIPQVPSPPINLATLSGGVSRADGYMTVPSAIIQFMEQDAKSRLLAKPTILGREGTPITLNLGEEVPVPRTTFGTAAPGQIGTTPTTAFDLRSVGVNLQFTPRVTYDGEIILQDLTVEKSAQGPLVNIAGQALPTFLSRRATTTLRLREGESSMLAGLIQDEEVTTNTGFPGTTGIPILRNFFGNTNKNARQIDVVMIITPRIVRAHEFTPEDFKARPAGTSQNPNVGNAPQLISPGAPPPPPLAAPGTGTPITPGAPGAPGVTAPPGGATPPAGATPPRVPGVVSIQPVGGEGQPPAQPARALLVPAGLEHPAGNVFSTPIMLSGVSNVGTVTVSLTFNPAVLRATTVTQGAFMSAGGTTTTFAPKIDPNGRVDIVISRPTDRPGATTATEQALLAAVNFQAVAAGTSQVTMTIVATTPAGQPVAVQASPVTITVK